MSIASPPTPQRIANAVKAIESRGVTVIPAQTKQAALSAIVNLIPAGSTVMTGASSLFERSAWMSCSNPGNTPGAI